MTKKESGRVGENFARQSRAGKQNWNARTRNGSVKHSKAWLQRRKRRRQILVLVWGSLVCLVLVVMVAAATLFLGKTEIEADASGDGNTVEDTAAESEGESSATETEIKVGGDAEETITHDTPDISNLSYPFNTMSLDWDESVLEGWWHYDIPDSYAKAGGYLPDAVQVYIYVLCKDYAIDYPTVLAMIEVESGYVYDAVSEEDAIGYMQVIFRWHEDRMDNLFGSSSEEELYNPYINIRTGIDFLAELYADYGSMEMALTAYNLGVIGAQEEIFSKGDTGSFYSDAVLEAAERIRDSLYEREMEVAGYE